jgi:multidrug efflux pump
VIVGGMSFGTLLTLFVVPTAYTLLAGRAVHREQPAAPPVGVPAAGHAD